MVQRSAWPVSYCVEDYPILIEKHWGNVIKVLQKPFTHHAVKRNTVRLLQHVTIPKKYQGSVMDICFKFVQDPNETIATKAFSLTVLGNFALIYQEIISEIKLLIEEEIPRQTPAFKSRAKHLLKQFKN